MTLAFVGALLIFFGSLNIFVWLTRRLIIRKQRYEDISINLGPLGLNFQGMGRVAAGNLPIPYIQGTGLATTMEDLLIPDEPPPLDMFSND